MNAALWVPVSAASSSQAGTAKPRPAHAITVHAPDPEADGKLPNLHGSRYSSVALRASAAVLSCPPRGSSRESSTGSEVEWGSAETRRRCTDASSSCFAIGSGEDSSRTRCDQTGCAHGDNVSRERRPTNLDHV